MTLRWQPMGERAVLIECGDLSAVRRVEAAVRAAPPDGLADTVPAQDTVLLTALPGRGPALAEYAQALVSGPLPEPATRERRRVVVGVVYDGPDLADVAALTGLSVDEVVARHTAGDYEVAFLGFTPGFPYLLGLDPALAVPRLDTPRTSVPAGSVGIGGDQTGVYPAATPGGWRLLGRTDMVLFDPARDPAALLAPGDTVRFAAR
jgi:KipI family sensor histidine kinase inhibitor